MKRVVEIKNGHITVKTYGDSGWMIAEYHVDLFDPYVRMGLVELGWRPPVAGFVGTRTLVREGNAQESKETQTEGDAGKALQEGSH